MKILDYLDRYLVDRDYRITVYPNRIHIMNYLKVEDFSNTKVVIRYEEGVTTIIGTELVVSRMQDEELFITGKVQSISF